MLQKNLAVLLIAWPPSDKGSGKKSRPAVKTILLFSDYFFFFFLI